MEINFLVSKLFLSLQKKFISMNHVDLNVIIERKNLDKAEIAKHLFPKNLYPMKALSRVLDGKANLDTVQLNKLSVLTGLSFEELYGDTKWKSKASKDVITFTHEDFIAELDTKEWTTKLYHKESLFHEALIHKACIPINEYLNELNNQINKFKNEQSS